MSSFVKHVYNASWSIFGKLPHAVVITGLAATAVVVATNALQCARAGGGEGG